MISRRGLRALLALGLTLFGVEALAHARLKTTGALVPRSTNPGIKTAPCGGLMRSATPAVFSPGQTITVDWEETINHPGRFEFYFSSANDANFTILKTVNDDQDGGIVGTNYHQYSTTLTLPNATCNDCTLQMIQVMTESNPPSLYYSCADIRIQTSGTSPSPTPVPAPSPSPAPAPNPACKSH